MNDSVELLNKNHCTDSTDDAEVVKRIRENRMEDERMLKPDGTIINNSLSDQSVSDLGITYEDGEKVLAYHQMLLYEAKILKKQTYENPGGDNPKQRYFVHYQGWNDRWDEWVDSDRVLKFTEGNRKLQEDLRKEYQTLLSTRRAKSKKKNNTQDQVVDIRYRLELSPALQTKVVNDWNFIIRMRYLITLPRSPNVVDILRGYLEKQQHQSPSLIRGVDSATASEVILGIRAFFDRSLGVLLLYRFERRQYSDILKQYPDNSLSEIYGFEHLLRLFVRLPQLWSDVKMEGESLTTVKAIVEDLIGYMTNNIECFSPQRATLYQPASPLYIKEF